MLEDNVVHCWEDGGGITCILPDGHDGDHDFISDSDIEVKFANEWFSKRGIRIRIVDN